VLLLEIGLTVVAWRKGWGARALLPMGIGLVIAFLTGMALTLAGLDVASVRLLAFALDIAVIVAQVAMIRIRPGLESNEPAPAG
jgi:hypothetical protein